MPSAAFIAAWQRLVHYWAAAWDAAWDARAWDEVEAARVELRRLFDLRDQIQRPPTG
jgi:hypothetical protein